MSLEVLALLAVALVVSADNFAVALALGALGQAKNKLRIALTFALFGSLAPLAGIWLGSELAELVSGYAEWLGAGLLAVLGAWTLYSAKEEIMDDRRAEQATSAWGLALLALTLSLDNLAAGFGLGLYGAPALAAVILIAASVFTFTFLGVKLGNTARRVWERRAVRGAGMLLLVLAFAMALSQLLS